MVDSSGSIRDNNPRGVRPGDRNDNWRLMLEFMSNVIDRLDIGSTQTLVGAVRFSNFANLEFPLGLYQTKQELRDTVRRMGYVGGSTNTYDGLRLANEVCFNSNNGDRSFAPNVAILITDGIPTRPRDEREGRARAISEAARLRQNAQIFAVGITNAVDETFLSVMSSEPQLKDQNYFSSPDFQSLEPILNSLVSQACAQTTTLRTVPFDPGKSMRCCLSSSYIKLLLASFVNGKFCYFACKLYTEYLIYLINIHLSNLFVCCSGQFLNNGPKSDSGRNFFY